MIVRTNRRAVTLVEVLIAIFLMGIGLMAVLSLFPLGAAQMAQAIQDQRAAEAATTAAAYARVIWNEACDMDEAAGNTGALRFVDANPNNMAAYPAPHNSMVYPAPRSVQRFVMTMDDPQYNSPAAQTRYTMSGVPPLVPGSDPANGPPPLQTSGAAAYSIASYPVLVDPIGFVSNQTTANNGQWWVGSIPTFAGSKSWRIPRRPLYVRQPTSTVTPDSSVPWVPLHLLGNLQVFKQFSLMDDITFNATDTQEFGAAGAPKLQNGNPTIERQGRYSWAFMFRRPHNSARSSVDITCILYSGRSIDVPSQEITYPGQGYSAQAAAGTGISPKQLLLDYTGLPKPAIRRGGWVLDASLWNTSGQPDPQGLFYRVVNVDDSTANLLALELQTPLLGGPAPTQNGPQFPRAIVVMDKVVEVFTKPDVSRVSPPMPY
jgi:hypothetical protein